MWPKAINYVAEGHYIHAAQGCNVAEGHYETTQTMVAPAIAKRGRLVSPDRASCAESSPLKSIRVFQVGEEDDTILAVVCEDEKAYPFPRLITYELHFATCHLVGFPPPGLLTAEATMREDAKHLFSDGTSE